MPYTTTQVQVNVEDDYKSRIHFYNWFLQKVYEGVFGPKLTSLTGKAWFPMSENTRAQNNRYWTSINRKEPSEVPFHDQQTDV
jgi:hypothetical protein